MSQHIHNELERELTDLGLSSTEAAEVAFGCNERAKELLVEGLKTATRELRDLKRERDHQQNRCESYESDLSAEKERNAILQKKANRVDGLEKQLATLKSTNKDAVITRAIEEAQQATARGAKLVEEFKTLLKEGGK